MLQFRHFNLFSFSTSDSLYSLSSRPTQPQPWPLPPPRVTSQEPDASVTATSCAGDASELHDVELNESSLRDRIVKAEQSTTPPAPLQATDSVNLKTSSQQPEQAFIVQDSERHVSLSSNILHFNHAHSHYLFATLAGPSFRHRCYRCTETSCL